MILTIIIIFCIWLAAAYIIHGFKKEWKRQQDIKDRQTWEKITVPINDQGYHFENPSDFWGK